MANLNTPKPDNTSESHQNKTVQQHHRHRLQHSTLAFNSSSYYCIKIKIYLLKKINFMSPVLFIYFFDYNPI